jgi:hypothetical protein
VKANLRPPKRRTKVHLLPPAAPGNEIELGELRQRDQLFHKDLLAHAKLPR